MEPYYIINMLLSVLVDTDNMDAAGLDTPERVAVDYDAVKKYVSKFEVKSSVDEKRRELFEHIDTFDIDLSKKIYTLTAQTGLGKTLTSLNFALRLRKKIEGYRPKVIYVAPFISILDQNLEVFQKVFGTNGKNNNLLSIHHHLAKLNQ